MIIKNEEVFFLNKYEEYAIFIPLRNFFQEISKVDYNNGVNGIITNRIYEIIEKSRNNSLLSFDNKAEIEIILPITNKCNMSCRYCLRYHEDSQNREEYKSMTPENLKVILHEFFQYAKSQEKQKVKIEFANGGEPLVEFQTVKFVVELCNELCLKNDIDVEFTITSNGTFSKDIREFLVNNIHNIIISVDGPKEITDLHRIDKNCNSVFDIVMENVKYLYLKEKLHSISVVVTEKSLYRMREIADYFIKNIPNTKIKFGPVFNLGRVRSNPSLKIKDIKIWNEEYGKLKNYCKDKKIELVHDKNNIEFNKVRMYGCKHFNNPNWIVDLDYNISVCTNADKNENLIFGKVDIESNELLIDKEKIDEIKYYTVDKINECKSCFCKYLCGGGCANIRLNGKEINCIKRKEKVLNSLFKINKQAQSFKFETVNNFV